LKRALTLAYQGDHVRATAEAAAVVEAGGATGRMLAEAADVHVLAATASRRDRDRPQADRAALAERYAARAVALLVQAARAGYFRDRVGREEFRTDPDYEVLRSRRDFQALMSDLIFPEDPFAP
jgi:hypothetical protein